MSTDEDDDMYCSRKRMKRRRCMSGEEEEEEGAGPITKKSKSGSRRLVGPDFAVLFPEVVTL